MGVRFGLLVLGTLPAQPVELEHVIAHNKPVLFSHKLLKRYEQILPDLLNFTTLETDKMVMLVPGIACYLVPRLALPEIDLAQHAHLGEQVKRAVDRRHSSS